jgi:hypothetical protein
MITVETKKKVSKFQNTEKNYFYWLQTSYFDYSMHKFCYKYHFEMGLMILLMMKLFERRGYFHTSNFKVS